MKLRIQALGIVMVLFGSPIIHFFRDFANILPRTPLLMPLFNIIFFLMILDFKHFRSINKPNNAISITAWCFLVYSFFLFTISSYATKPFIEIFNYTFLAIYFYLICGVDMRVSKVILPIIIVVTTLDNLALIVAFIANPFTQLGERAIISDVGWGEGAGNPTLYSFMAYTGIIASFIHYKKAPLYFKLFIMFCLATSAAVILMTIVRATIFTLFLSAAFYFITNYSNIFAKSNLKKWYDFGISKSNFIILSFILISSTVAFMVVDKKITEGLTLYVEKSYRMASNVIETIIAKSDAKKPAADPSAGNRITTFKSTIESLQREPIRILFGFGYRYMYVDIPIIQVLLEEGVIGLLLLLMFHYYVSKNSFWAARVSDNSWILFLIYYYMLLLMNSVSRGEPYDPYFWNYFLTIARFLKPQYFIINKSLSFSLGIRVARDDTSHGQLPRSVSPLTS